MHYDTAIRSYTSKRIEEVRVVSIANPQGAAVEIEDRGADCDRSRETGYRHEPTIQIDGPRSAGASRMKIESIRGE